MSFFSNKDDETQFKSRKNGEKWNMNIRLNNLIWRIATWTEIQRIIFINSKWETLRIPSHPDAI